MTYKINGMDAAILGCWYDEDGHGRIAYSHELLVKEAMLQADLTREEALEHVDFNMTGGGFRGAPIIIFDYNRDEDQ